MTSLRQSKTNNNASKPRVNQPLTIEYPHAPSELIKEPANSTRA